MDELNILPTAPNSRSSLHIRKKLWAELFMQSVERKRPAILRFTVRLSPSLSGVVQNEKQRKEEKRPQDDDNDE